MEENILFQLVKAPTHGNNILDLVITGNPDIIDKVEVEEPFGNSDHYRTDILPVFKLLVPRVNTASREVLLYSKANYAAFNEEVRQIQWDNILRDLKG